MPKKNTRTTNTIFNFTSSIGGQLITIIMQFVVRTVFINTLGKSYLGINGLFSNILTMLSLAEFGVGSAILYKLYEPIAHDNHRRIAALMNLYKKIYRVIGIAVAILGCLLIPFLPLLINDYDKLLSLKINVPLVFLLYLLKTVSSYLFFAYKSAIIKANQKEYLINVISYLFTIATAVLQIIFLLIWPNFMVYVAIMVVQIILQNIACALLSDKMYPYINENTNEQITTEEIKNLFKDCSALFLYKLNGVVLKATDNIVLSVFLGLDYVAMYSNYYVFYTTINTLNNKVFNSVSHSLGNLHADSDKNHEYRIFESVILITAILGGTAGVGLAVVADEFVNVWIGQDWIIKQPFAILMGIEVVTLTFRIAISKYRTTMGLFQQAMYRPIAGMIINLVVSVVLVNYLGICGVLIGTIVADWSTVMWYDPIIIHKHGFNGLHSSRRYFIKVLKYVITISLIGVIDYILCKNVLCGYGWTSVVIHAIICALTIPVGLIAISINTAEGKYVYNLILRYIRKLTGKLKIIK